MHGTLYNIDKTPEPQQPGWLNFSVWCGVPKFVDRIFFWYKCKIDIVKTLKTALEHLPVPVVRLARRASIFFNEIKPGTWGYI